MLEAKFESTVGGQWLFIRDAQKQTLTSSVRQLMYMVGTVILEKHRVVRLGRKNKLFTCRHNGLESMTGPLNLIDPTKYLVLKTTSTTTTVTTTKNIRWRFRGVTRVAC